MIGAIGGTFGPLHAGHMKLFEAAFEIVDFLKIGLMTDDVIENKTYSKYIPPYSERYAKLIEFLNILWRDRYDIYPITDGKAAGVESDADILIISNEADVVLRSMEILKERKRLKKSEIYLLIVPLVCDDVGNRLSSTRIRKEMHEIYG